MQAFITIEPYFSAMCWKNKKQKTKPFCHVNDTVNVSLQRHCQTRTPPHQWDVTIIKVWQIVDTKKTRFALYNHSVFASS